ncbi:MAG: hypothetical protein DME51_13265 [Verrucomicrobia bacterium]|nr:MAG: hypothetical protein DME51_13265 [Verrucomicrobiota bacterium]
MRAEALLLSSGGLSLESANMAKVLRFFGVPSRAAAVTEFLDYTRLDRGSSAKSRALCSSDIFFKLIRELKDNSEAIRLWRERAHSVFVYAGNDSEILQKLLQTLTGDEGSVICKMSPSVADIAVSDCLDEFSGVMAGVRVTASGSKTDSDLVLNASKRSTVNIISLGGGAVFSKFEYEGVPIFLSTSREIIDIDAELTSQNFDVREHFLSAVPLVLYVKWAFAETCWNAPETNACLVIDDPVLKSTHAVSVHGCDHTRAEFGSSSQRRLYWKAQQALERMNRHQSTTGIRHDPVMVFPQGIFSEAAMSALKRTDLVAAVNNDVVSADPHRRAVTVSELWDIAVMGYSNFPLFTRRYPWEGIENFAFDALLGKPAIAVIHHDYCSDHCARLVNFIKRLNAPQCAPTWRSLGEVVRRSCRQREVSPGEVEVEMYGTELRIENRSEQSKHFGIRRRECEPSAIREVSDGTAPIPWSFADGYINFELELGSGESKLVAIKYQPLAVDGRNGDNLPYRLKTMLRRYLCEVRDNYVTTARLRLSGSRRRVES